MITRILLLLMPILIPALVIAISAAFPRTPAPQDEEQP